MNQSEANRLISSLGVIVLLDAPQKIQLGVDNTQWVVGQKFKGIKLVPLGPHYIHYALADEKYQFKLGFFCILSKENRIVVRRWNLQYEDFLPVDPEDHLMYVHAVNINDLDNYLGPYPTEKWDVWSRVTSHINQKLLDKLDPIVPKVYQITDEYVKKENRNPEKIDEDENEEEQEGEERDQDQNDEINKSHDSEEVQNEKIDLSNSDPYNFNMEAEISESVEQLQSEKLTRTEKDVRKEVAKSNAKEDFRVMAGTIYYTEIPQRLISHGSHGSNLTSANFDKSEILKNLIKNEYKDDQQLLLGEFEYAFVKFLLGESYDSFEQWKKLFVLLTSCEKYVDENATLYMELIPIIYNQLQQVPKDFFIDPLAGNSFIKVCLNSFFEICLGDYKGDRRKVVQRAEKLKQMIQQTFISLPSKQQNNSRVIEDNDENDEAPQIVEDFNFYQI